MLGSEQLYSGYQSQLRKPKPSIVVSILFSIIPYTCLRTPYSLCQVDVTLTKIEEIDSHFIAWSSSVLAAWLPFPPLSIRYNPNRHYHRHFYHDARPDRKRSTSCSMQPAGEQEATHPSASIGLGVVQVIDRYRLFVRCHGCHGTPGLMNPLKTPKRTTLAHIRVILGPYGGNPLRVGP